MPKNGEEQPKQSREDWLSATTRITAAWLQANGSGLPIAELPGLLRAVHAAITTLGSPPASPSSVAPAALEPAVPIRKSVQPDYIVCLEDGKRLKMLKRHLKARYQMTPDQYRAKWGLRADYPMVAPNYSKDRSRLAKSTGLGRSRWSDSAT